MTLRTPRRRISPQTKRRYKAIKGFFRRALGSPSQSDLLQIASSIAVNVTHINHKILGLEQQLSEVSKQCRDINYHEDCSTQSKSRVPSEVRNEISQRDIPSGPQLKDVESNIILYPCENPSKKSDNSDRVPKANHETKTVESNNEVNDFPEEKIKKSKKKRNKNDNRVNDGDIDPNYRKTKSKSKSKSTHENFVSAYSTSSFHSVDNFREMFHSNMGHSGCKEKRNRTKVQNDHNKDKTFRDHLKKYSPQSYDHHHEEIVEKVTRNRKSKRNSGGLDQDFIADIIRRQYRPVNIFGRKQSDLSLFSAPVCRDHNFPLSTDSHVLENLQPFVCNCGGRHRYAHHNDLRSLSNTQLYNVQKSTRKKHSKKHVDAYNDSSIYDLVPVKEKTSPKSRRKFFEDHMPPTYCKEVPPSPRSHRPRLNLKAQYSESDYTTNFVKNSGKRLSPKRAIGQQVVETNEENNYPSVNRNKIVSSKNTMQHISENIEENYDTSQIQQMGKHIVNKRGLQTDIQREIGTVSSLDPVFDTEENTAAIETSLNKTQETVLSDKTDKALCEIKDILQNFLLEMKKDASHSSKSEVNTKINDGIVPPNDVKTVHNNGPSFGNYNSAQCPVSPTPYISTIPTFGNTCCYPVVPVCHVNCMQNSCAVSSPSFTCNNCVEKCIDINNIKDTARNNAANDPFHSGTDELIKEIYKFVSRSPIKKNGDSIKEESNTRKQFTDTKALTSRSAGGSIRVCKLDAKVGTPETNCVSRSCEAFDSKISSEMYTKTTNASYTDSISEKLSLEPTGSVSTLTTEFTTEISVEEKTKKNRFTKVMQSLGLCKKNKKDVIEELSESESTIADNVKKKPPFRQDVTNYAMYGQEYYRPPPQPPRHHPEYAQDYRPPYNPEVLYRDPRIPQPVNFRSPYPQYHSEKRPTAPPYCESYESYNQIHSQVPFCLKEVEVKSIGCQSERKMSFFRKITQKAQRSPDMTREQVQRNGSTQTQTQADQNKPGFFNWKIPHSKLMDRRNNSLAYSLNFQKNLMEKDQKMKNAMVKKLFNKRNPFSQKNPILKTLLGQDQFNTAVPTYRPRTFF